ncbi:MAG: bifunctional hydroxymethylpyrimidine kinase/phosphomethylpyrimidine kinase [Pseudomonadota bacterium]
MTKKYFRVLSIAGSDSGGGAGIQADLKTFSALGCYGMTVITALTAQNTVGVGGIFEVPPSFIREQLEAVLEDIGTDAVKIGMLHTPKGIRAISRVLRNFGVGNVVLDTVMTASTGNRLLKEEATESLKKELFPLAAIVTPNIPEAEILLGRPVRTKDHMAEAVVELARLGPKSVLLKGGHLPGSSSDDLLYAAGKSLWLEGSRIVSLNTHGTGCTLSSAIAAFLARGYAMEAAVKEAKNFVSCAIDGGKDYQTGQGHGPVHHFYKFWC